MNMVVDSLVGGGEWKGVEGDKKDLSLQINFTTFFKASAQCLPPHFQGIILIFTELGK